MVSPFRTSPGGVADPFALRPGMIGMREAWHFGEIVRVFHASLVARAAVATIPKAEFPLVPQN
jgi:hypothetical protein